LNERWCTGQDENEYWVITTKIGKIGDVYQGADYELIATIETSDGIFELR